MAKGQKTGGRKAGTPNKITAEVKDMVLTALENVGGVEYLEQQAKVNATAFMTLVGKVLPLQVTGAGGGPVAYTILTAVPGETRGDDAAE